MATISSFSSTPSSQSMGRTLEADDEHQTSTANKEAMEKIDDNDEKASHEDDDTVFLSGSSLFLITTGITVVMTLAMLDISIISTAIPQITSDFHKLEDVGWYVGAYQLASATTQPLTGKMFATLSLKWTYLAFFGIFEAGSAICGAASSSTMFIVGRAVAGLGCSGLVNGSLTIITSAMVPYKRPLYLGIAMGISQIGIVSGPLLGGAFTEHATWRWCFYINLPLGGLAAIFIAFTRIPDQIVKPPISMKFLRQLPRKFDLIGFALIAPAAIMFLLALQFGTSEYEWDSSQVIGLFSGAGVTFSLFAYWEYRVGNEAMLPFSIVGKRVVWASSINYAFLMTVTTVGGSFIPIYFQSVRGLSPTMSGVYMLPGIGMVVLSILVSGAAVTKFGYYLPWAVLASVVAGISCGLISTWAIPSGLGTIMGYQLIYGIRGAGMQMGVIAIQNSLPPAEVAFGNSFIVFCQNILGAIIVTIANLIFQDSLGSGIRRYAPSVDLDTAIAAGGSATAVRGLAPAGSKELHGILTAFAQSFDHVFYLLAATSVVSFAASFGMGWVDVRNQEKAEHGVSRDLESASKDSHP